MREESVNNSCLWFKAISHLLFKLNEISIRHEKQRR